MAQNNGTRAGVRACPARPWTLIDNDSHTCPEFRTRRELQAHAKRHGMRLHRQFCSDRGFYAESVGYVPGNE